MILHRLALSIILFAAACIPAVAQLDTMSAMELQIGGPPPVSPFALDRPTQLIPGKPAIGLDPALMPKLQFDPVQGITTQASPEFYIQLQTLPQSDQQSILDAIGSLSSGETATWFAPELTPEENLELNSLLGRSTGLTPEEQLTLQNLLERSMPVPMTPLPLPVPTTPIPIPVGTPRTTPPAQTCLNGTVLPAICQFSTTLPVCQCP